MTQELRLSPPDRASLSWMMFLQFFIWGAWFVTLGTYLGQGLAFDGVQVAAAYSTMPWGAIVAPFLIGMIADRFSAAERGAALPGLEGLDPRRVLLDPPRVRFLLQPDPRPRQRDLFQPDGEPCE